jgi:Tol biopolymer transport system component
MTRWGRGGAAGAVVLMLAAIAGCTPRQPWSSELASVDAAGDAAGNHESRHPMLSADGTTVVFQSRASDLVPNDTNGTTDVFVRDLATGETSLVSVGTSGTSGNNASMNPVISADGRKVAFESNATDLTTTVEPNGAMVDVYVRDLDAGVTSLVATSTDGVPSPAHGSRRPEFSPDGNRLAFCGNGLHPLDPPAALAPEIYVRDLRTGVVDLVTVNATGDGSGNDWSLEPGDFSPDGSQLAFTSPSSNLVPGDTNQAADLFVRDLTSRTTTLVSANLAGTGAGNAGTDYGASFGPDGTSLAFTSRASDLVATDTNEASDVFVRDLTARTTRLVSVNAAGTDSARGSIGGSNESSSPVYSPDGRSIAFVSDASDFGPTDTDDSQDLVFDSDVYLRDLAAGTTSLVSTNAAGTDNDRGRSERPVMTADGRRILFYSDGAPLDGEPSTDDDPGDLYLKDLVTGTVTLVSAAADGTAEADAWASGGSMSADGLTVAWETSATNLAAEDTNGRVDVYVARLQGANITAALDPVSAVPGSRTTVRATVLNAGPHAGPDTAVVVQLPAGATVVDTHPSHGTCTDLSADHPGVVACGLGDLAVGQQATVAVVAVFGGTGGEVRVLASSGAVDPEPTDNLATRRLGM